MGWKAGYTFSDERSPTQLRWPNHAVCAVSVVVDLSVPGGSDGIRPADLETTEARYAFDVSLPRILALLEQNGIRATFPVPAVIAQSESLSVERVISRGHEIAAHGLRHEDVTALARPDEAARMDQTIDALSALTGRRPAGWYSLARQKDRFPGGSISANTIDLLMGKGFKYFGNSQADDVPHYLVTDPRRPRKLLALPYSYSCDDQFFVSFPPRPGGTNIERILTLESIWNEELEAMIGTEERPGFNRVVTAVIHPYLNGWGHRLRVLERFLRKISRRKEVWVPTGSELASHWFSINPPESIEIRKSLWRDAPGKVD
ncbi:MAG: polysaccharide deacetylase family protein [Gammaproteobacteria bacterium]|nr:polysaccharide deacetylase family protein [Gammaproteobacteria bacterium]